MSDKKFKLKSEEISELAPGFGACIATDRIIVDGLRVGYMYREEPDFKSDSGWRFLSGTESQEYIDESGNMEICDVNTIANYDATIIPYLDLPIGTQLERKSGTDIFRELN